MTKTTGLGDRLMVNEHDLSGEIGSVQTISDTSAEQDVTGLNKVAIERLQLLSDAEISFNNFFTGDTAGHAHAELKENDIAQVTYFNGTASGNWGAGLVASQFDYKLTRGQDGALLGSVVSKASGGFPLDWGRILEVDAFSDTSGDTGAAFDLGAAHGIDDMVFYIHVTDFNGTDATILVQMDTADTFGSPTTYGSFTVATGETYQRLAVAGAPERYIRWSVTGTYTDLTFSILACAKFD